MVERTIQLNAVFSALADPTRRDILKRVSKEELSISTLAEPYRLSFAAIAKHITALETAKLITKRRDGKKQFVCIVPKTIEIASRHLEKYEQLWQARFDALDSLLKE
ncbi:winged helix-turn-helix transcriptional regulator [Patescibacteria group bacterium]|nr:winged helix-turn-helix transcriptional regulator [Patescibacteria group bacterium]